MFKDRYRPEESGTNNPSPFPGAATFELNCCVLSYKCLVVRRLRLCQSKSIYPLMLAQLHMIQEPPIRLMILFINVILCLLRSRFPAIFPVIAKCLIFSFLLTWPKNLICLTVIIFISSPLVSVFLNTISIRHYCYIMDLYFSQGQVWFQIVWNCSVPPNEPWVTMILLLR